MVAIGVITPFMVPIKVTMLIAFVVALPVVLYQIWAFVAPDCMRTKTPGVAAGRRQHLPVHARHGFCLFLRLRTGLQLHRRLCAEEHHAGTGHRGLSSASSMTVPRLRRFVRGAGRLVVLVKFGLVDGRQVEGMALPTSSSLPSSSPPSSRRTSSRSWRWRSRCACSTNWAIIFARFVTAPPPNRLQRTPGARRAATTSSDQDRS